MFQTILHKLKVTFEASVCASCFKSLGDPETLFCAHCHTKLCFRDATHASPKATGFSHAATVFNPILKSRLYGYKFYAQKQQASFLANVLIFYWRQFIQNTTSFSRNTTWVITIPPHQGAADRLFPIAGQFSRYFGYKTISGLLCWQRDVLPQHSLHSRKQRFENVQNGFYIDEQLLLKLQKPERIILIDDMMTTGATLQEAVKTLQQAGFEQERISTLTITRGSSSLYGEYLH